MLNSTRLFHKFRDDELNLSLAMKKKLQESKVQVRSHIRKHLSEALIQEFNRKSQKVKIESPRFRTQGSWSHGTINMPAYHSQQLDIDDGCYIPVSVFEKLANPKSSSDLFFRAMDTVLSALCEEKGWKLDSSNPSCVRLIIQKNAHIDVPLYATPEDTYEVLEAKAAACNANFIEAFNLGSLPTWSMLETDQVLLAIRGDGWKKSDPGPISEWVQNAKIRHGMRFTNIVRYMKAWRDYQWETGGPTSISLMVAIEGCLSRIDRGLKDDHALLLVTQKLHQLFSTSGQILNPDDEEEDLTEKLDRTGQRQDVVKRLTTLANEFEVALNAFPDTCNRKLMDLFGPRFPYDPSLISSDIEDEVRAIPARVAPVAPMVRNTKAA